jgi:hypothetical protein
MKATLLFILPALATLILSSEEPSYDMPAVECHAPKLINNKNINPSKTKVKYSNWEFQPIYTKEQREEIRRKNEGC